MKAIPASPCWALSQPKPPRTLLPPMKPMPAMGRICAGANRRFQRRFAGGAVRSGRRAGSAGVGACPVAGHSRCDWHGDCFPCLPRRRWKAAVRPECGSAAAMAAGAVVDLLGGTPEQIGHAVALALKSLLGLVCDPVAGLVEVPCVKRNARRGSHRPVGGRHGARRYPERHPCR